MSGGQAPCGGVVEFGGLEKVDLTTSPSINGDAEREQRIFPEKFTANDEAKPFSINATSGLSPAAVQKYLGKKKLKLLPLSGAQVTGDFNFVNALSNRQTPYSYGTEMTGDLSRLRALTKMQTPDLVNALASLQKFGLSDTQVTDDIGSLSAPASLQTLDLEYTKVEDDVSRVNALTNLQYLRRLDTKLTRVVNCLSALTILQAFYIYRTEVTGDFGGVLVSPSWRRTPEPRWAEPAGVCLAETHCSCILIGSGIS